MSSADPIDDTIAAVRAGDRDLYVATLLAPAAARPALFALYGFDLALADVVRTTSEAPIGLIRLAWWRDAVAGPPIAGQPLLAAVRETAIEPAALAKLAEAHMDWLEGNARPGALLFQLAGQLLDASSEGLEAAGSYWAAGQAARQGAVVAAEPPMTRFSAAARPVTALAAIAARDLAGRREPRGSVGRQLAAFRHMLTGRI